MEAARGGPRPPECPDRALCWGAGIPPGRTPPASVAALCPHLRPGHAVLRNFLVDFCCCCLISVIPILISARLAGALCAFPASATNVADGARPGGRCPGRTLLCRRERLRAGTSPSRGAAGQRLRRNTNSGDAPKFHGMREAPKSRNSSGGARISEEGESLPRW